MLASPFPRTGASRKENHAPEAGGAAAAAALAAGVVGVGLGLLRRLHARSASLAWQLSETRSELESKSSQLNELLEELACTRCVKVSQHPPPPLSLLAQHALPWLS